MRTFNNDGASGSSDKTISPYVHKADSIKCERMRKSDSWIWPCITNATFFCGLVNLKPHVLCWRGSVYETSVTKLPASASV